MSKPETFNLMVRIPRELHERVAAQAASEDRSQRAIVTRALERELAECDSLGGRETEHFTDGSMARYRLMKDGSWLLQNSKYERVTAQGETRAAALAAYLDAHFGKKKAAPKKKTRAA